MARVIKTKELNNTKLATNYGGWMYCTGCNTNIGYLCYVTYDKLDFNYTCHCGSKGSAFIEFEDSKEGKPCGDDMITVKNRLCCPKDESPMITVLKDKLESYDFEITCKECGMTYHQEKKA